MGYGLSREARRKGYRMVNGRLCHVETGPVKAPHGGLELPFKPFTPEEIAAITACSANAVENWITLLEPDEGSGEVGLGWPKTFAVYVANCWMAEGSGKERAVEVAKTLSRFHPDQLRQMIASGLDFVDWQSKKLVPAPKGTLAARLSLGPILRSFDAHIRKVFPNG